MKEPFLYGWRLVAAITSINCAGLLLFGWDQGAMSGVVISKLWLHEMGDPSSLLVGTITSLYNIGAVFGSIGAALFGEPLGRRKTLIVGVSVLMVGAILMATSFGRAQFMVSRVITGMGVGFICSVGPVYQAEIARAKQRGWQVCCQQTTMLFGLMLTYWVNYAVFPYRTSFQWRFPLAFQIAFGLYIFALAPFLPDTPRWLMLHKGEAAGLKVLAALRGKPETDDEVQREKNDILDAIALEEKEAGGWMDLLRDAGVQANKRFYLSMAVQFMQQMTGINIVTYYAPTLFQVSLNMTPRRALFMGCLLQLWYIIASFVPWFTIERVGRRLSFISMAFGMCLVLVAEAVSVYFVQHSGYSNNAAAISASFFVFAFEACFSWGWMANVWVYPAEILPLKIRARGAALAAAVEFLGNYLVVQITPYGVKNLGWKFYLVWAATNLANAVISWMFCPETAGQPLEALDTLFAAHSAVNKSHASINEVSPPTNVSADVMDIVAAAQNEVPTTAWARFASKFQWSMVPAANKQVQYFKHHEVHRRLVRSGQDSGSEERGVDGKEATRVAVYREKAR